MRLGDLDALKKATKSFTDCDGFNPVWQIIDKAPTVEVHKIEHKAYNEGFKDGVDQGIKLSASQKGEWIFMRGVTCGGYYKCNRCGEVERAEKNYCSNCGAQMKGDAE